MDNVWVSRGEEVGSCLRSKARLNGNCEMKYIGQGKGHVSGQMERIGGGRWRIRSGPKLLSPASCAINAHYPMNDP